MLLPWLKKDKLQSGLLGLDIGSAAVKLVSLQREGEQYSLSHYAIEPLSNLATNDQTPFAFTPAVSKLIQKMIAQSPLKTRKVAIAIPDNLLVSRLIYIDKSVSDLEAAVTLAAARTIPYPLDKVNFDFQILRSTHDQPHCLEILLVACRKQLLERCLHMIEASGLTIEVIEPESHALERAYEYFYGFGSWEKLALIDIGYSKFSILLRAENEIIYTRSERLQQPDNLQAINLQLQTALHLMLANYLTGHWNWLRLVGGNRLLPAVTMWLQQTYGWNTGLASMQRPIKQLPRAQLPCLFLSCGLALRRPYEDY